MRFKQITILLILLFVFFANESKASNDLVVSTDIFLSTSQGAQNNFDKIQYSDTCMDVYDPVCGVNKETYSNYCYAMDNDVEVNYKGVCILGQKDCTDSQCELAGECVEDNYVKEEKRCDNGEWVSNICTVNDWSYQLKPAICSLSEVQTKYWVKSNACVNGIVYPTMEEISCEYKGVFADVDILDILNVKKNFVKIYKRIPDMNNLIDSEALLVMMNGVDKNLTRNLEDEKRGLSVFIDVFKRIPELINDWNIVKSISYFKVEQMLDSDSDLVPDSMESDYGTNKLNPDSDWDGYGDGFEILNLHNPINRD